MQQMVTVLFFGPLAELTGVSSMQVPPCADTQSLQQALHERFPALVSRKYALAVNQVLVQENERLTEGSVVAFLPPFSGG